MSPLAGRASVSLYHLWRCHAALQVSPLSPPLPSNPLRTTRVAGPRPLFTHKGTQSHTAPQPRARSSAGGGGHVFQDWTNSLRLPQSEGSLRNPPDSLVSSLIKDTQSVQGCSLAPGFTCESSLCHSDPEKTSGEVEGADWWAGFGVLVKPVTPSSGGPVPSESCYLV